MNYLNVFNCLNLLSLVERTTIRNEEKGSDGQKKDKCSM